MASPVTPKLKLPQSSDFPLWQTFRSFVAPLDYWRTMGRKYGDIFTVRFFKLPPVTIVSHPQGIQEIFEADPALFDAAHVNARFIHAFLGDNSVMVLDGARHQRTRQLLMPPFHGERMRSYAQLICQTTEDVMGGWSIDRPLRMRSSMQEITLRVILQAVFGLDRGVRYDRLRQLFGEMLDTLFSPWKSLTVFFPLLQKDLGGWSPWGRFARQLEQVDELIYAEIAERRYHPQSGREDVLSLMMSARDGEGKAMSDVELRDELVTLLFAGHETVASSLAWAFYWIHRYPEVRERLVAELDGVKPLPENWVQLPYLNAVCCETLRIVPILMFSFVRILKAPFEVMGYQFEPGDILVPSIYTTHYREDIYPEPERFRPERFLERKFSQGEYLPFGGGAHRCLGQAFAQSEFKLVLATVLHRAKLRLAEPKPVRAVHRGFTFSPKGGVKMVLENWRESGNKPLSI
ncbi:MAG: cytochrome P450 [Cyanobacteriota bacterium]|nr:cytochrome P450 [Cyanobacteriota bacterium]